MTFVFVFRDKNFNAVGPVLSRKAKLISSQFEERHGEKTVQEIKQFVARLPHMMAAKASLATRMFMKYGFCFSCAFSWHILYTANLGI
jgi:hypothetical protein